MRIPRLVLGPVLAACLAGAVAGCGGGQAPSATRGVAASRHALRSPVCEPNPSDGVHDPERLKVLEPCATFRGTVSESSSQNPSDGDVSFNVAPDPGYESMLNATNRSEGGLHVEIVPRDQPGCTPGQPVRGKVPGLGTCSGRDLTPPPVGAHVRLIGPWVLDEHNDWHEMHPVWSIEILHPAAKRHARVVLGRKHLVPHGIGWGTAHPRRIFNGGDPSGRAWHLAWRRWGAATARARGLTWIFKPRGGYYRKPGLIELRASRIGRCTPHGPRAYTHLQTRVAVRPGGRLTHWSAWGGWKSTCKGPS